MARASQSQASVEPHEPQESVERHEPLAPEAFRKALNTWYRKHARVLPWRGIRNPYATWLSEIMLQQTRVATVTERYVAFLARFPTLADLAAASEDAVLALWSGLGYYRRARMLQRGAQFVVRELGGVLPSTSAALRTLPGVGEYTAAAIASIAFGESIAVLDGNVERVLLRLLGMPEAKVASTRAVLLRVANELVPPEAKRRNAAQTPGDHNQAMMELGATICLPRGPLCLQCPVFAFCRTRGEHPTAQRAPLRSRHVACLLATRKRGASTEILLERRAAEARLMPGMLELPPLPLEAVAGREPVLRLRHSITNTNFYVEVFAEGEIGLGALPLQEEDILGREQQLSLSSFEGPVSQDDPMFHNVPTLAELQLASPEEVFEGESDSIGGAHDLLAAVPAAAGDLLWLATRQLQTQPLTGLARKALQRLGLMSMLPVRVGEGAGNI